jgi:hypothetical protein
MAELRLKDTICGAELVVTRSETAVSVGAFPTKEVETQLCLVEVRRRGKLVLRVGEATCGACVAASLNE